MNLSGDILQASDDLSHVINSYEKIVKGQTINGETESAQQTQSSVRQGTFTFNCVSREVDVLVVLQHYSNNYAIWQCSF